MGAIYLFVSINPFIAEQQSLDRLHSICLQHTGHLNEGTVWLSQRGSGSFQESLSFFLENLWHIVAPFFWSQLIQKVCLIEGVIEFNDISVYQ